VGFTNVAWESRSTEQLARDLADGPGPMSVGQAGAAWVRIANELASVSQEYDLVVDKIKGSFSSQGADAAARRLEEFGGWLQAVSLSAAGNAEQAAVANSVAVLAMPTVSAAVEARTAHDVMASLAAYNGAILDGRFAEFDEAATADQTNASAVMYQYEQACEPFATPWEQPLPPDVSKGAALTAERDAKASGERAGGGVAAGGGAGVVQAPLAPFRVNAVKSSGEVRALRAASSVGGSSGTSGVGGMGSGYGPMAAAGRGTGSRDYESSLVSGTLDGGGEPGAGLSDAGGSWLPAAQPSDAPFVVSDVSWGPSTSIFDELAVPDAADVPSYADEPERTLEQVSDRWVAPPVIGSDKALTL
jgi:PPE family